MSSLPRLLIVDDEPELCQIISETLRPVFRCTCCFDPSAVLSLIEQNDYDLVLTDVHMSKLSAEGIVQAIQSQGRRTPVLLMSGNDREDPQVSKALKAGAKDVISKPLPELNELIRILRSHLRNS